MSFVLQNNIMNRRKFIYNVGMAGASLPFLNSAHAATHAPRAKSVINIFLSGGLSQFDSFNMEVDSPVLGNSEIINSNVNGIRVSHYFPTLAQHMDKLLVINSMKSNQGAHPAGIYKMMTSYDPRSSVTHPELGAWVSKRLTSAEDSLPNFVSIGKGSAGTAGFFPGQWAALPVKSTASGIEFVNRNSAVDEQQFNQRLGILDALNNDFENAYSTKDTRAYMDTYQGSLRFMNSKDIDAFKLENENKHIVDLYDQQEFSRQCMLAGRLVERGVRYVKVELGGWDYHDNIYGNLPSNAGRLDKGLASLLKHLTQKGLLDSTLVVVSTEFGRKPQVNPNRGRDHHPNGFTCLLAGAGVKAGQVYGTTSKDGEVAEDKPLDVTDFNATIAWTLGIDPAFEEKSASGRPFKLANSGEVREELFV